MRWTTFFGWLAVGLFAVVLLVTPFGLARPEVLALTGIGFAILARP